MQVSPIWTPYHDPNQDHKKVESKSLLGLVWWLKWRAHINDCVWYSSTYAGPNLIRPRNLSYGHLPKWKRHVALQEWMTRWMEKDLSKEPSNHSLHSIECQKGGKKKESIKSPKCSINTIIYFIICVDIFLLGFKETKSCSKMGFILSQK